MIYIIYNASRIIHQSFRSKCATDLSQKAVIYDKYWKEMGTHLFWKQETVRLPANSRRSQRCLYRLPSLLIISYLTLLENPVEKPVMNRCHNWRKHQRKCATIFCPQPYNFYNLSDVKVLSHATKILHMVCMCNRPFANCHRHCHHGLLSKNRTF